MATGREGKETVQDSEYETSHTSGRLTERRESAQHEGRKTDKPTRATTRATATATATGERGREGERGRGGETEDPCSPLTDVSEGTIPFGPVCRQFIRQSSKL